MPWLSAPTSPSSPGSEGSTSPPKPTDTDASDRSSGTPTAPESSSDGGRLFPVGEMSPRSALLPTPSANQYENQDAETIEARRTREVAKGRNGNGFGLTTAMALTLLSEGFHASPPPPPVAGREPPMIGGSGPSSPVSLASWDPELSSWRTSQVSLLSTEDERFPRSSERWPTSGMTRRGRAFALPMSERHTDGNGSGYLPTLRAEKLTEAQRDDFTPNLPMRVTELLHTPTTGDTNPNYDHRASPGYTRAKPVPNLAAQVDELMPSPAARDGKGADLPSRQGPPGLPDAVTALLPTPKTPTGGAEARARRAARGSGGEDLEARLRSLGDPTSPRSGGGSEP